MGGGGGVLIHNIILLRDIAEGVATYSMLKLLVCVCVHPLSVCMCQPPNSAPSYRHKN